MISKGGSEQFEEGVAYMPVPCWTTEKPTQPGFYWHRSGGRVITDIVYFDGYECHYTSGYIWNIKAEDGDWAGPLQPPAA